VTYSDGDEMQLGKLSRSPTNHKPQNILASAWLRGARSYLQNRVDGVELIQPVVW
jgi:hypothetical protein